MKLFCGLLLLLLTPSLLASEWVTLEPEDFSQYEISQANALGFASEGLYIKHKSGFATSLTCAKKEFVVITDPKLADRALTSLLFAMTTQKTMRFYVDGCSNNYLHAKMLMLIP